MNEQGRLFTDPNKFVSIHVGFLEKSFKFEAIGRILWDKTALSELTRNMWATEQSIDALMKHILKRNTPDPEQCLLNLMIWIPGLPLPIDIVAQKHKVE